MSGRHLRDTAAGLVLMCLLLGAAGCGRANDEGTVYYLYQIDQEEGFYLEKTALEGISDASGDAVVDFLVEAAASSDALLPEDVEILGYTLDDQTLSLDFSESYVQMDQVREVLCRAAIVVTLTQADEVESVVFTVEGAPLADDDGDQIGEMTDETFINNPAGQINSTQKATVILYFTDSSGEYLYPEQQTLHYFTSMSVEWMVVERLIKGPQSDSLTQTVPSGTSIISVISADGICYVNLDQAFLSTDFTVSSRITLYSIVNSLCALDGIESVQIAIDGETDVQYSDEISLDQSFSADEDLIADTEAPVIEIIEEEDE